MKKYSITHHEIGEAFWRRVFESAEAFSYRKDELKKILALQDSLRPKADYNTGSIDSCTEWVLYSIISYFCPKNIVEIGTFIGKSTTSMALALDHMGCPGLIQTCDHSNGFDIGWSGKTKIIQNFKTSSTEMLIKIDSPQDILFVDGRLNDADLKILQTKNFKNTVIIFDDTIGTEKGVVNQVLVDQNIKNRLTISTPSSEILKMYNFHFPSVVSLSVPMSMLTIARG
mgnify:CR=1 FL=1